MLSARSAPVTATAVFYAIALYTISLIWQNEFECGKLYSRAVVLAVRLRWIFFAL